MGTTTTAPRIRLLISGARCPEMDALFQRLAQQQTIVVVGELLDAAKLVDSVRQLTPDVVLLCSPIVDVSLQLIALILSHVPNTRLLLITGGISADNAVRLLEHGARGVLSPSDLEARGLQAIQVVHSGEIWASRALLSRIAQSAMKHAAMRHTEDPCTAALTGRENEIATLLRSGASNKQIAAQLSISDKTVKTHLQNIFGKMQIHRRQHILPALRLS